MTSDAEKRRLVAALLSAGAVPVLRSLQTIAKNAVDGAAETPPAPKIDLGRLGSVILQKKAQYVPKHAALPSAGDVWASLTANKLETGTPDTPQSAVELRDRLKQIGSAAGGMYQARRPQPRGWLGQLVSYGSACLAAEIYYVSRYGDPHLSPYLRVKKVHKHIDGNEVELDEKYDNLSQNRFIHWPAPVWTMCGPDIASGKGGLGVPRSWQHKTLNSIVSSNQTSSGIQSALRIYSENQRAGSGMMLSVKLNEEENQYYLDCVGQKPARNVIEYYHYLHDNNWGGTIGSRAGRGECIKLLESVRGNKLKPHKWFVENKKMDLWNSRITRWFRRAQFLVWSCEMLRLQKRRSWDEPYPPVAPAADWWVEFCTSWGVLVPELPNSNIRMTDFYRSIAGDNDRYRDIWKSMEAMVPWPEWNDLAKTLISEVGYPGHPAFLGQQIRPPGQLQTIIDFPTNSQGEDITGFDAPHTPGSLGLTTDFQLGIVSYWRSKQDISDWGDIFSKYWNAALSLVAQVGGVAAEAQAAIAGMMALYGACTGALRMVAQLANGQDVSPSSVAGALISVGESLAAVIGAEVELSKIVPESAWKAITSATSDLSDIVGVIGEIETGDIIRLRDGLISLVQTTKWDFVGELYGGLFLKETAPS